MIDTGKTGLLGHDTTRLTADMFMVWYTLNVVTIQFDSNKVHI